MKTSTKNTEIKSFSQNLEKNTLVIATKRVFTRFIS